MKRITIIAAVILLSIGIVQSAHADAAPPATAPGTGIEGQYPTNVQMVSEDVLITIKDDHAEVVATFDLRNQGTVPEAFDVRFPIGVPDHYFGVSRLTHFAARVDGELAEAREVTEPCLCGQDV